MLNDPATESYQPSEIQSASRNDRPNYLFVHNIRFWSMVAIVAIHTVTLPGAAASLLRTRFANLLIQPFKFGTICFFLVSGFLMADRLPSSQPSQYMKRRIDRLFTPWIFWVLVTMAPQQIIDGRHMHFGLHWCEHVVIGLPQAFMGLILYTPFWFVPNLLVAMCCLLVFRKRLDDLRVGAIFLAMDLFYAVNIYFGWLPTNHTEAVFGFVFFLWLGAWCARNFATVKAWSERISPGTLMLLILFSGFAALVEAHFLALRHRDGQSTIRVTNQIFSLLVALALFKLNRRTWPRFVDVSRHTYGIYLIHPVVVLILSRALYHGGWWRTPSKSVACGLLLWGSTYAFSLALSKFLVSRPNLAWIVGVKSSKALPRGVRPKGSVALPGWSRVNSETRAA